MPSKKHPMRHEIDNELLRQEYFLLQSIVESFDQKSLTIKAWSVTLSMTGIGAGFTAKVELLFLLSALSSFLSWLIDASWKIFQQANYYRLKTIEDYFNGKIAQEDFRVPDITGAWSVGRRKVSLSKVMFWSHVLLPHAIVTVVGIVLWLISFACPLTSV